MPLFHFTFSPNATAMQADNFLAYRQSQPRTFVFDLFPAFDAIKPTKDLFMLAGLHAYACVAYRNLYIFVRLARFESDAAALGCEFHRVLDEVESTWFMRKASAETSGKSSDGSMASAM